MSADTLARWHRWWRHAFVRTAFWRAGRGQFAPAIEEDRVPRSLLEKFTGDAGTQVVAALRFVSPLTTASAGTLGEGC